MAISILRTFERPMGNQYKSAHFGTRAAFLAIAALIVAAPEATAQDGAALYKQRCAGCHDGNTSNRAPDRAVIAALTADRIVDALEGGVMRAEGEKLTPLERRASLRQSTELRQRVDRLTSADPPSPTAWCSQRRAIPHGAASVETYSWRSALNERGQR